MPTKTTIHLYGYWLSANYGDYITPIIVRHYLHDEFDVVCVNLIEGAASPDLAQPIRTYTGQQLSIYKPSAIAGGTACLALFMVGSLTENQAALKTIEDFRHQQTMATVLIWGGLQDYSLILNDAANNRNFKQFFRDLVADSRVHLTCRSVHDMSAIAALAGLTEPYPRYILGSDPLLLFHPPPIPTPATVTGRQVGVILSVHAFAREMPCVHQFYAEAMAQGVSMIGIDGGTDALVPLTTVNGSYELCHFMQSKHYLITTRLHGALLAACLEIPVVAIALNEKFANVSNPDGIATLFPVTDSFNHVLDNPEYIEQFRSHRGDRVKAKHLALAAIQYIKHVSRSSSPW